MHINPINGIKRVVAEYTGVESRMFRTHQPPVHIDDYARSVVGRPIYEAVLPCLSFTLPNVDNAMWLPIPNIAELRLTPPTKSEELWRVGFEFGGNIDSERQNEYVMSEDSVRRMFTDWVARRSSETSSRATPTAQTEEQ